MTDAKKIFTLRVIVQMVLVVFVAPLIPMIISGQWRWWQAWAYAVASTLAFIISRILAGRRHPDLIAERAHSMEMQDAKPWDKILSPMLAFGSLLILIVAGADKGFGWSTPFTLNTKLAALLVIILGFAFGSWALIENKFFSGVVRIQTDRGHHVVTTGPYRFVL
jgi:protein-S-isoprenylcysteine O-methyltransferase Ste14